LLCTQQLTRVCNLDYVQGQGQGHDVAGHAIHDGARLRAAAAKGEAEAHGAPRGCLVLADEHLGDLAVRLARHCKRHQRQQDGLACRRHLERFLWRPPGKLPAAAAAAAAAAGWSAAAPAPACQGRCCPGCFRPQ
jgi:hypothetical protein